MAEIKDKHLSIEATEIESYKFLNYRIQYKQTNGFDCGIWCIKFLQYVCLGLDSKIFTQSMDFYRYEIKNIIKDDEYNLLVAGFSYNEKVDSCFNVKEFNKSLQMKWLTGEKQITQRKGLVNLAQTCYLNSILQCLFSLPPLVYYVLGKRHYNICLTQRKDCIYCYFHAILFKYYFTVGFSAIKPEKLYDSLPKYKSDGIIMHRQMILMNILSVY